MKTWILITVILLCTPPTDKQVAKRDTEIGRRGRFSFNLYLLETFQDDARKSVARHLMVQ